MKHLKEQEHIRLQRNSMRRVWRHTTQEEVERIEADRHGRELLCKQSPGWLGREIGIWLNVNFR